MTLISLTSALIEIVIALIGLQIATAKKPRPIGWFIFITFGIYVFYDLSRFLKLGLPSLLTELTFLIATLSAFALVWKIKNHSQ